VFGQIARGRVSVALRNVVPVVFGPAADGTEPGSDCIPELPVSPMIRSHGDDVARRHGPD